MELLAELEGPIDGLSHQLRLDWGLGCLGVVMDYGAVEVDVEFFDIAVLDVHHLPAIYERMARFRLNLLDPSRPKLLRPAWFCLLQQADG